MGADASKDGSTSWSRKGTGLPSSWRPKSSLIAKWQKRQLSTQCFSIVRHAERADGIYAFVDGTRWHVTEDFKRWPLDPPLSDAGLEQAQEMGRYLEHYAEEQDSVMHVVISSPYFRCIQTAVLICTSLGPGARLLVDRSLGEVYGPSVMGSAEPCSPIRTMEETLAYCSIHGVTCHSRIIGTWPTWPEQLKDARRRYCLRFFSYLQRSETTRRNFILVAHGDCVGAVLSTMPSLMHQVVEKVDYGGLFVAKRKRTEKQREKSRKGTGSMTAILPATAEEAADHSEEVGDFDLAVEVENIRDLRPQALHGNWMEEAVKSEASMTAPKASDAWEVELHGIAMRQREGAAKFQKRLRTLAAQSELSSKKIEQLLGELADQPLGDDTVGPGTLPGPVRTLTERSGVVPSCYSVSTYLFGASDAGCDRDFSTREFETFDDPVDSCGTSSSLVMLDGAPGAPDSPREARPRRCITPQQLRALTPGTPRRSVGRNGSPPASQAFAHRRMGTGARTVSSTASAETPQRAATLQALMERNSAAPVRTPSLRNADEIMNSTSEGARRSATTLLPVFETPPQEPAQEPPLETNSGGGGPPMGGMQNSALMRRRRSAGPAAPQAGTRLRLLPSVEPPADDEAALEIAAPSPAPALEPASPILSSQPSSTRSASPPSPARVAALSPAPAGAASEDNQGAEEAPAQTGKNRTFAGLDGSALFQRRRNKRQSA